MKVLETVGAARDSEFHSEAMEEIFYGTEDCDDLKDLFDGYFFVIENDEDYEKALHGICMCSAMYYDEETGEIHVEVYQPYTPEYGLDWGIRENGWVQFGLITSNDGGNSYFIKEDLFLSSELTKKFKEHTSDGYQDTNFFEGIE